LVGSLIVPDGRSERLRQSGESLNSQDHSWQVASTQLPNSRITEVSVAEMLHLLNQRQVFCHLVCIDQRSVIYTGALILETVGAAGFRSLKC